MVHYKAKTKSRETGPGGPLALYMFLLSPLPPRPFFFLLSKGIIVHVFRFFNSIRNSSNCRVSSGATRQNGRFRSDGIGPNLMFLAPMGHNPGSSRGLVFTFCVVFLSFSACFFQLFVCLGVEFFHLFSVPH